MPIHREFLGWKEPGLAAAGEFLRARFERAGELDLSGVMVVVPGARAGRRLVEVLVGLAEARQLLLTPPDVVTPEQFPERLYQAKRQFADTLVQQLAWMKALLSFSAKKLAPLLAKLPGEEETLQWLSLAESFAGLHKELAADGLDCGDVLRGAEKIEGFAEHERWKVLCKLQRAYLDRLDELELWDVQTARLVAIKEKEIATEKAIVLVGTADLNRAQRRMLDLVADRVTALIIAPPETADRFDEHGCVVPGKWTEAELPLADEQIERVDGPADQAEAVTRWMASLGGRFAADHIVVGLGDEKLVPQIERQLAQCGVAARFAEAKKVRETGPYRLLKVAADYAARGRYRDLAALVRQPEVEARDQESGARDQGEDVLTVLDRFAMERMPASLEGERLAKEEGAGEVLAVWQAAEQLVKDLKGEARLLGEWGERLRGVLAQVYGGRELDRTLEADRYLLAALQELGQALDVIGATPEGLQPRVDARQACRIVLEMVANQGIAPPANPQAVELMGWLELPLDDAPALVVTSFNEGLIPKGTSADVFLPNRLREALGLVHNDRRLARDAYALSVLLASRWELRLIVAHRDAEGNPLTPSRLLFATAPEGVVRRARWLFGELTAAAPRRSLLAPAKGAQAKSLLVPPRPTKLAKPFTELRVTQFRDYIACPYRFYLRHVLELEALGDQAAELDGAAFGGLVHQVLEQFGRSEEAVKARNSPDAKEVLAYLEHQLDRVAAGRYSPQQARPAVRVQIEQVRLRLKAFAEWQAQRTREGWRIVFGEDSEDRKASLVADFPVDGKAFKLRGRIDRIDYHEGSKKLAVLDYKTADAGEKPERTHCRGEEWIDLQLPLYRHLLRAAKLAREVPANAAVELGYVLLPRNLAGVGLAPAGWEEERLQAADEKAREIIRRIWREEFWPPQPAPDFEDDFGVICQDHRLGASRVIQEGDAA